MDIVENNRLFLFSNITSIYQFTSKIASVSLHKLAFEIRQNRTDIKLRCDRFICIRFEQIQSAWIVLPLCNVQSQAMGGE